MHCPSPCLKPRNRSAILEIFRQIRKSRKPFSYSEPNSFHISSPHYFNCNFYYAFPFKRDGSFVSPALTALPRWVSAVSINVIRFGFLGLFEKLRKATLCFVMSLSLCPSVCPHGANRLLLDGFSWNFVFEYCSKICRENSRFIKIGKE